MAIFDRAGTFVGVGTALLATAAGCGGEVLLPGGSGGGGSGGTATSGSVAASSSSGADAAAAVGSSSSNGGADATSTGPVGSSIASGDTGGGGDGGVGSGGAGGDPGTGGGGAGGDPGTGGRGGGGAPPTDGVLCGDDTCFDPAYCLLCDPTHQPPERACGEGFGNECQVWGRYPPLRILCDGHDDCRDGELCVLFEGSLGTYTDCWESEECLETCENCFFANVFCETVADCPPCATSCAPYADPDYPVSVCTW